MSYINTKDPSKCGSQSYQPFVNDTFSIIFYEMVVFRMFPHYRWIFFQCVTNPIDTVGVDLFRLTIRSNSSQQEKETLRSFLWQVLFPSVDMHTRSLNPVSPRLSAIPFVTNERCDPVSNKHITFV
ncbi:hypothetical protein T4E_8502 [Trichinella pseudospiralis]|uniref:Uncharacterized protein n=1 Tax=Trichinella pseudospiralis TaxID=6337 RepID=A0A0V0YK23_TRIPS|nr:hypothetical protein T4E_8502 [Trichinella pseudospiralis]